MESRSSAIRTTSVTLVTTGVVVAVVGADPQAPGGSMIWIAAGSLFVIVGAGLHVQAEIAAKYDRWREWSKEYREEFVKPLADFHRTMDETWETWVKWLVQNCGDGHPGGSWTDHADQAEFVSCRDRVTSPSGLTLLRFADACINGAKVGTSGISALLDGGFVDGPRRQMAQYAGDDVLAQIKAPGRAYSRWVEKSLVPAVREANYRHVLAMLAYLAFPLREKTHNESCIHDSFRWCQEI